MDCMTDLFPVYQVTAVENRKSWIINKRRSKKIIVFAYTTDRRVWINPERSGFLNVFFNIINAPLHEKLINYKVSEDALMIAQEIGNDYAICANKMSRNRNCSLSRF